MTARPAPSPAFRLLAGLVVAGSVVVRFALLDRQSYWIDELFSVSGSDGSFRSMLRLGAAEVHTPLYAVLLWGWTRIGGSGEAWTRTLSTICALVAVVAAHRGLRGLGLSEHVRWALTVATAAGGTSIVYSLETRNYALLGLGAVGLTVTTLRAALATLDAATPAGATPGAAPSGGATPGGATRNGAGPSRGTFLAWTGWAWLAATAHLFGAVLALSAVAVLAALAVVRGRHRRVRLLLAWTSSAVVACSGQAAWLLSGVGRPGFASGTSWIPAPRPRDVRDLLTTTFSSGGLAAHRDGFAWTSWTGLMITVVGCAGAAVAGYRVRRRRIPDGAGGGGGATGGRTAEGSAAAVLLGLALVVVVAAFGVSQWLHLWTLRNLSVVAPALVWGAVCLAAAAIAPGGDAGRRTVATVTITLLGVGLVPIADGLAGPYKTDFRGLFGYLGQVRASSPDAVLIFVGHGPPLGWGPVEAPLRAHDQGIPRHGPDPIPVASAAGIVRTTRTQVVVLYRGVADPDPERAAARLAARLAARPGPGTCRTVPMHGLGVVRCG